VTEIVRETTNPQLSEEDLASVIELLEQISVDRGLLALMEADDRNRLLKAAGQLVFPGRAARRKYTRARRRQRQDEDAKCRSRDDLALAETGIRKQFVDLPRQEGCPSEPFQTTLPPPGSEAEDFVRLEEARNCYVCKRDYDRLHPFYDALCQDCAEFNWTKRHQTADLTGRFALLTGGRVKIGYQAALKLLRAGASVIVTTRFPRDAAERFSTEDDHLSWTDRLQIYGLDLRHTPSVEWLASHLVATLPRLDFILNNACQTVRRPPSFYSHLMKNERRAANALPETARTMLSQYELLLSNGRPDRNEQQLPAEVSDSLIGIQQAAELSQVPLTPSDKETRENFFPAGQFDVDLQQIDLRAENSWRLRLADVPTVELLEVHLVNAVAPFVLNARLRPLMKRVPTRDKHIVNVSAMEGIFYRAFKTDKHPHTNMAKAALNMLTRTSAQDCVLDGIHMNSVDTGWITDEDPAEIAQRKRWEHRFHPPLDLIDAAARICDPIFSGLLSGQHVWGKFLKDYQIANW